MINHIYKIDFYQSADELSEDYERLCDYEKEYIADLNADSFFDYENYENDFYVCYVITTPSDMSKYSKILKDNLIRHECVDISYKVLRNEIDLEDLDSKIDENNFFKYDFFIDDVNDWIYHNLEIDIVLDRIIEVGMKSLKEVEINFLKSYNL